MPYVRRRVNRRSRPLIRRSFFSRLSSRVPMRRSVQMRRRPRTIRYRRR